MPDVSTGVGLVLLVVHFATIVVSIYAFVMSLVYSPQAYDAAGKWSKQGWTIVLGLGALFSVVNIIALPFFVSLAFLIAALVFLADVKPALASLRRR